MVCFIRQLGVSLFLLFASVDTSSAFQTSGKFGNVSVFPPKGWNSYDSFTWFINEEQFLSNCQAIADTLLPYGYDTCVVDYKWYQSSDGSTWSLDEFCRPIPDPERWPSAANGVGFRAVADKVHAMGLKFGIHIMRGTSTYAVEHNCKIKDDTSGSTIKDIAGEACPWMAQSLSVDVAKSAGIKFYESLYQQYADEWQVDFIKNDCVFGNEFVPEQILAQSDVLSSGNLSRKIVYSLSPGGYHNITTLIEKAKRISSGVNMYRITGDDWDAWRNIYPGHFDMAAATAAAGLIAAKGLHGMPSFPDMDMLPLGYIAAPGDEHHAPFHNTSLTPDEQKTQMTLWAMARSPLFFGGDATKLAADNFTLGLLTNRAILEVDERSIRNREVRRDAQDIIVWAAEVATSQSVDNTPRWYSAAFNVATSVRNVSMTASDFGLAPQKAVGLTAFDSWNGRALGDFGKDGRGTIKQEVPSHGVFFVVLESKETDLTDSQ